MYPMGFDKLKTRSYGTFWKVFLEGGVHYSSSENNYSSIDTVLHTSNLTSPSVEKGRYASYSTITTS